MALRVCRIHRALKVNGYCLLCKKEREKRRYDNDPDAERARKRDEYNRAKSILNHTGDLMSKNEIDCEHSGALAVQEKDLAPSFKGRELIAYFCAFCGLYLDESGEPLGYDPTDEADGASHAGKASRPQPIAVVRAEIWGTYHRDETTMVEVRCGWPGGCTRKFNLYPQNVRNKNYCPQVHQALVRRDQTRERQRRFRQNHG